MDDVSEVKLDSTVHPQAEDETQTDMSCEEEIAKSDNLFPGPQVGLETNTSKSENSRKLSCAC